MNNESHPVLTADRNILTFWEDSEPNGLIIGQFNRILMVRVAVPGDNKSFAEYKVDVEYPKDHPHPIHGPLKKNDEIYKRFGKYIEEYKKVGGNGPVSGTPLEEWPVVNRAQIAMLKHNGVYSVEALSTVSDSLMTALGIDGRRLVQKAKDYLETAKNSQAAMDAMERERKMQERFDALEAKYNALTQATEAMPDESKSVLKDIWAKVSGNKAA